MNRKIFIKNSAIGCLAISGITAFYSCSSITKLEADVVNNHIEIPLSLMEQKKVLKLKVRNLEYDVLLIMKGQKNCKAYLMKCTHNDTGVVFDGKNFQCPLHGSSFDQSGAVTNGPATISLKMFSTTVTDEKIIISIF